MPRRLTRAAALRELRRRFLAAFKAAIARELL